MWVLISWLFKIYIYRCKFQQCSPNFQVFLKLVQIKIKTEYRISEKKGSWVNIWRNSLLILILMKIYFFLVNDHFSFDLILVMFLYSALCIDVLGILIVWAACTHVPCSMFYNSCVTTIRLCFFYAGGTFWNCVSEIKRVGFSLFDISVLHNWFLRRISCLVMSLFFVVVVFVFVCVGMSMGWGGAGFVWVGVLLKNLHQYLVYDFHCILLMKKGVGG